METSASLSTTWARLSSSDLQPQGNTDSEERADGFECQASISSRENCAISSPPLTLCMSNVHCDVSSVCTPLEPSTSLHGSALTIRNDSNLNYSSPQLQMEHSHKLCDSGSNLQLNPRFKDKIITDNPNITSASSTLNENMSVTNSRSHPSNHRREKDHVDTLGLIREPDTDSNLYTQNMGTMFSEGTLHTHSIQSDWSTSLSGNKMNKINHEMKIKRTENVDFLVSNLSRVEVLSTDIVDSSKSQVCAYDREAAQVTAEAHHVLELFPFICGFCHKHYNKIDEYFMHLNSHKENREEFFHVCKCNDELNKNLELVQNRLFHCGLCGKVFKTVCHLHQHVVEAEGLDEYVFDKSSQTVTQCTHTPVSIRQDCGSCARIKRLSCYPSNTRTRSNRLNRSKKEVDIDKLNNDNTSRRVKSMNKKGMAIRNDSESEAEKCTGENETDTPAYLDSCGAECDNIKIDVAKGDIADDMNEESRSHSEEESEDRLARSDMDENDNDIFKQIEKHQLYLKKKRMHYKERAQRRKKENCPISKVKNNSRQSTDTGTEAVGTVPDTLMNKYDTRKGSADVSQFSSGMTMVPRPAKCRDKSPQQMAADVLVPCHICGQMYKKRHLHQHVGTHSATRDHVCDICHKGFKTKSQLHNHKKNHIAMKNFVCEICGKPFKTKPNFKQHRRTHTAVKDIPCPLCSEMFNNKYILQAHMLRHSDVKSHVCDTCGRAFKRIDQLTRHQSMHSDARPFQCSDCGKTFKTRRDCCKHEKIHQPHRYFCPYCNKGFVNTHNRKVHMKTHLKSAA